jgi:hypothetical protein
MRIDAVQSGRLNERSDDRQLTPPSSLPANNAFLRFKAMGRVERSTILLSISMRPSSRKRVRSSHG